MFPCKIYQNSQRNACECNVEDPNEEFTESISLRIDIVEGRPEEDDKVEEIEEVEEEIVVTEPPTTTAATRKPIPQCPVCPPCAQKRPSPCAPLPPPSFDRYLPPCVEYELFKK